MFCEKCGNQVNDNIKFCPHCDASQTDNPVVEKLETKSEVSVLVQNEKSVKNSKMSKGRIAAIGILAFELVIICGVFVFFSVYKSGDEEDNASSPSSLDEANENAELAYDVIEEYINNLYHPQDYAAHGFFSDVFNPNKSGELNEQLSEVIDDGYVKILLHDRDDYYDDLVYTVQWCEDKSGDGTIGQYPDPIEEDYENSVEFGTIFEPDSYASTTSFKDNFSYELDDDGNVIITGYKGSGKNVVIPEYVSGVKVVAIADNVFSRGIKGSDIESVTIPGSIKEIGDNAFCRCSELETVKISEGVETIGDRAFWGCTSLKEIEIPDSVETIEEAAFYHCNDLEYVKIPDSVEKMDDYAFGFCENLKEVEIEDGHRFMFKNIFTCSFIFYEYLFKVIAIGVLVITIIIMMIVSACKKHKTRKAEKSSKQEAPLTSEIQKKVQCPQCAAEISPDTKFCGKCGHKM